MSLEDRICPECEEGELKEKTSHNPLNLLTGYCLWSFGSLTGTFIANGLGADINPTSFFGGGSAMGLVGAGLFYLFDIPYDREVSYECDKCGYDTRYAVSEEGLKDYSNKEPSY